MIIENAHFSSSTIRNALEGVRIGKIIITHQKDQYLADPAFAKQELGPLMKNTAVIFAEDNFQILF